MNHPDAVGIGVIAFDWTTHGESDSPDNALTVENCLCDLIFEMIIMKNKNGGICYDSVSFFPFW